MEQPIYLWFKDWCLFVWIKYNWKVVVWMDLFKGVIRREIYLFMFMLGFAILKTASPQRHDAGRGDGQELASVTCWSKSYCYLKVLLRDCASLNLYSANHPADLVYLLRAEQLVQRKMSGLIVYPPNFDSWEMPKAHPAATTSLFESRAAGEIMSWIFAIFHEFAMQCQWRFLSRYILLLSWLTAWMLK